MLIVFPSTENMWLLHHTDENFMASQLEVPCWPTCLSLWERRRAPRSQQRKHRKKCKLHILPLTVYISEPAPSLSPWSVESLSAGELSPSSIASLSLWPRRTLALGWFAWEDPCVRVEDPFLQPRRTSPVQLSWGPLSTLAAEKVCKTTVKI